MIYFLAENKVVKKSSDCLIASVKLWLINLQILCLCLHHAILFELLKTFIFLYGQYKYVNNKEECLWRGCRGCDHRMITYTNIPMQIALVQLLYKYVGHTYFYSHIFILTSYYLCYKNNLNNDTSEPEIWNNNTITVLVAYR